MSWVLDEGDFVAFGSRSGLLEPFGRTASQAQGVAESPASGSAPSTDGLGGSAPQSTTEAVVRNAVTAPQYTVYLGQRDDAPYVGAFGPRVRVGLLSDGTFGIERWSQAGVRTVGTFA